MNALASDAWLDALDLDDAPAPTTRGPVTDDDLTRYLAALNAVATAADDARGTRPEFRNSYAIDPGGRKFLRIVSAQSNGNGRSAFLFVEMSTGDLYKPASWKGPERNFPRGNLRDLSQGFSVLSAL